MSSSLPTFFRYRFSHVHRVCSTGPPFPESRPPGHGGPDRISLQGAVMRSMSSRRVVLFAALLLLSASMASAAPRPGSHQPAGISVGIGIPDVLSAVWGFVTGGWMKEGCRIDPSGRCVTTLPTKEGCNIDPSGRCLSTSAPVIQPIGASGSQHRDRRPVLRTKEGCHIDPSGRCIS